MTRTKWLLAFIGGVVGLVLASQVPVIADGLAALEAVIFIVSVFVLPFVVLYVVVRIVRSAWTGR